MSFLSRVRNRAGRPSSIWTLAAFLALLALPSCEEGSVKSDTSTQAVASVTEGSSTTLSAIPRDTSDNVRSARVAGWTTEEPAAAVTPTGRVGGDSPGAARMSPTSEGMSGASVVTVIAAPPPESAQVLVGAGDIANGGRGARATASLLDNIPGTVFTAGDNAYRDGAASDYARNYDPTWGRHKARTRPSPGNHEYHTSGASGYFDYFGALAGPAGRGYYSYDLGEWHIISLNSNIAMKAGSPQEQWLRADLAANSKDCILAYWHHPRFSSGTHGSSTGPQPLWQALYEAGAEIVVVGHDHNYQRFAPQTATGVADPDRGIRQFVAGMGGAGHYVFNSPIANTEAYDTNTYGVLKLTLGPGTYSWEFIPEAGKTYTDSGSGTCHR